MSSGSDTAAVSIVRRRVPAIRVPPCVHGERDVTLQCWNGDRCRCGENVGVLDQSNFPVIGIFRMMGQDDERTLVLFRTPGISGKVST